MNWLAIVTIVAGIGTGGAADPVLERVIDLGGQYGPGVLALAMSFDGSRMAVACTDGTVKLFDTATWQNYRNLTGHVPRKRVNAVAFSPADGGLLASASDDTTIRLWRIDDGASVVVCNYTGPASAVAFTPNGKYLVSGSWDDNVDVHRVSDFEWMHRLQSPGGYVGALAISPIPGPAAASSRDIGETGETGMGVWPTDPATIAFASRSAFIWQLTGSIRLREYFNASSENWMTDALAFSADGETLVFSWAGDQRNDNQIWLWSWREREAEGPNGKLLGSHSSLISDLAFHPDEEQGLLASSSWDCTVALWRLATGRTAARLQFNDSVDAMAFTRDGKRLVAAVHYNGISIVRL